MSRNVRGVKGMPDLLPEAARRVASVEAVAAELFAAAGFAEIRTPILEPLELFVRSVGEGSDIVRKEMYVLEDLGGRRLALRPEGTAGVVRAVVEHGLVGPGEELRLWYRGPMFRYERPQKGRQRQFRQVGIELIGNPEPHADAEVIALAWRFLERLGVRATLELNSLGGEGSRAAYREALVAFAAPRRAELCADCQERLERNPLRTLDCKVASCQRVYAEAPKPLEHLVPEDAEHFERVRALLAALEVPYRVDPNLVRGLDYYTRTVFEFRADGLGAQDTVLAGGRYDRLVAEFGGPEAPAVGFAAGVERLLLAAGERLPLPESRPGAAWIALDEEARTEGLVWAERLRTRGVPVLLFSHKRSLRAQLRAADRSGARYALLRGERERAAAGVVLKDLATGEQEELPLELEALAARLEGPR